MARVEPGGHMHDRETMWAPGATGGPDLPPRAQGGEGALDVALHYSTRVAAGRRVSFPT